jgi:hypothetical protein
MRSPAAVTSGVRDRRSIGHRCGVVCLLASSAPDLIPFRAGCHHVHSISGTTGGARRWIGAGSIHGKGAVLSEKNKPRSQTDTTFSVGNKVLVPFGNKKRLVRIIEDRGNIGRDGRRLLRVAFALPYGAPEQVFEIPAEDVTQSRRTRRIGPKVAAR